MAETARTIEILQGNDTLRRLMISVLTEVGLEPRISDAEDPVECAMLVADVDSGSKNLDARIETYAESDRPVLYCGLRISRERFEDAEHWVERPFSLGTFVMQCLELLGVKPEETTAPSTLFPEGGPDDTANLKPPKDDDAPELTDDPTELETVIGDPELPEEALEFDEDSSMVLAVEDIRAVFGGQVLGAVNKRLVDTSEIRLLRESDVIEVGFRTPSVNQTMPDTPIAMADDEDDDDDDNTSRHEPTGLRESSSFPIAQDVATRSQLTTQIRGVARMLAQSWQRIALTARTDDRADRIERILVAAVNDGLRGASEEVQRIPPSYGFAGGLQAMTLIDVLRTIRDRRLRGRLELAIGEEAYVLHCDAIHLDAIDVLTGSVDHVLLDILFQGGAIDESTYEGILRSHRAGEVFDLEMMLSSQNVVSDAALQSARTVRAKEVFRHICGTRGGQFAFLEVRPGDGQTWPVDPLRINVDELLLQILREASIDTGDSKATARTRLMMDPTRAATLPQSQLTELERSVMMFFRQGETLAEARERLEKLAGKDAVDKIVDRLKKLELLRRSSPNITEPVSSGGNTVVSDVPENISDVERKHRSPTRVNDAFEIGIDEEELDKAFEVALDDSQYDEPTVDRPDAPILEEPDDPSED